MPLVVAILLQLLSETNMAQQKHRYHITIKNLRTQQLEGFMIANGDSPYTVQGVDNIAQRIQDGEILYSDFTNSRVFAQENWSEGISKYWDPEKNGYYIFPSKKYKDKKNILIDESEFTLWGAVQEKYSLSYEFWEAPMCRWESAWVVYLWDGMRLMRSTDFWETWSVFKDFTWESALSDVNEITDIKYLDTETFSITHAAPLGTMAIPNIQEIFVCFYNRTTKKSGIARYTINTPTQRPALWSTYFGSWTSVSAAYWSTEENITINTSWLTTTAFQGYKVNNSQGLTLPGPWWTLWMFPWQRFKAVRWDGTVFNFTVWFVGGAFWWNTEVWVPWIPSFSSSPDSLNYYTITEVGRNSSQIILPVSWGISNYIWSWRWLWQNIKVNGILYNIYGIANWSSYYGNLPWYSPGTSWWSFDYIQLLRVDGWEAWAWIFGNGTQTYQCEKWIYKNGTYANSITKFIQVTSDREHLWGFNHIDPINKLYDPGFGEITTNASASNIYAASYAWVLHSAQNHTATFNDGDCPISWSMAGFWFASSVPSWVWMYVWTQYWSGNTGTESKLLRYTLNNNQTTPSYNINWIVWDGGISSMFYFANKLYMGTKYDGNIWEWDNGNTTLTNIAKLPVTNDTKESIIDAMSYYAWKVVCSNQAGSWVYNIDPNTRQYNSSPLIETDVLCWIEWLLNKRIRNICNTGGNLLFTEWQKIYKYDSKSVSETWYIESSIYWGYISNVDKLWVYGYVRVKKWVADVWQKVALQVSFDEWVSWKFCPTTKGKEFSDTIDWNNPIYAAGYENSDQQLVFVFPYNTKSGTILYRCWLKKGTNDFKPVVNHIGIHYNLNYKQELMFSYLLDLNKSHELLTGRSVESNKQNDKLIFLKDIWQNQDMVELVDVTGKKYTCIPFSDEKTAWQGLIMSTSNSNSAPKDFDNLTYKVAFSLKTIANYDKIL